LPIGFETTIHGISKSIRSYDAITAIEKVEINEADGSWRRAVTDKKIQNFKDIPAQIGIFAQEWS
jgi:molybdate-binding protein